MNCSMNSEDLMVRVACLEERIDEVSATDLDIVWIIISAIMVFFMQVGFAMLEVGSVHPKNTKAVLLKNICDASLGALSWWLVGFAFAHGKDKHGFIGTDMFALVGSDSSNGLIEARWMFDWAFTATSVTIVSGAIAERVKISAYVTYSIVLTAFIYPVVVHWAWQPDGWASPYRGSGDGISLLAGCGAADFAGSGVVHMVGGTAALIATIAVKPRLGRFKNGTVCRLPQQSPALQTLGTLILWVGWYAFNAGSSLTVSRGRSEVAARAAVTTTIAPSAAVLMMVLSLKIMEKKYDTRGVNNGILAGLVAITAGAPLVAPEGAFVIGAVGALVYYSAASFLLKVRVDDVVEASAVHLFGGIWGLVAAGLFTTREGWNLAYGDDNDDDRVGKCCGLFYGCGFNLLFANLALMASILAWVGSTSIILFFSIEATIGLRVPVSEEEYGMERLRQNSFTSVGSKKQGMDAVRRAITKAHLGYDENAYMGTSSRSYHGSRPESLSSSKHDELTTVSAVSNGKHDSSWGGGHKYNSKVERRIGPRPNVLGRPQSTRTETGLAQGRSQATFLEGGAEAITTNTIRGTAVGFNSHNSGAGDGGSSAAPFPSPTSETVNKSGDDEGLESSCDEEKVHETPPLSTA